MSLICPQCGEKGKCYHRGDGGSITQYWDLYEFECLNPECNYKASQTVYGGTRDWDDWVTECPYCGGEGPVVSWQIDKR